MDEFLNAVKTCLRKYATFSGRASRAEFWWFFLFSLVVNLVSGILGAFLSFLVGIALLVPGLAVGARRLHDIDKSGWLQLLWLVPVIGWAILIYWAVQPSGPANPYGAAPDPLAQDPVAIPPGA